MCLIPAAVSIVTSVYQESFIRHLVPKVFTGDWLCRNPLLTTYHPDPLERKQVFIINHIVCINSLDTVSHSYEF